MTIFGTHIPQ